MSGCIRGAEALCSDLRAAARRRVISAQALQRRYGVNLGLVERKPWVEMAMKCQEAVGWLELPNFNAVGWLAILFV